jgi:hypothetical protein
MLRRLVGIRELPLQSVASYHDAQKWGYRGAKIGSFFGLLGSGYGAIWLVVNVVSEVAGELDLILTFLRFLRSSYEVPDERVASRSTASSATG